MSVLLSSIFTLAAVLMTASSSLSITSKATLSFYFWFSFVVIREGWEWEHYHRVAALGGKTEIEAVHVTREKMRSKAAARVYRKTPFQEKIDVERLFMSHGKKMRSKAAARVYRKTPFQEKIISYGKECVVKQQRPSTCDLVEIPF
ncbi:hypothetical protein B0H13DRAFT_1917721 [Mycena leptocephala]|nr:hypothetical protein B0H13DRAFT_1917721 [Mycena leptocephala]